MSVRLRHCEINAPRFEDITFKWAQIAYYIVDRLINYL